MSLFLPNIFAWFAISSSAPALGTYTCREQIWKGKTSASLRTIKAKLDRMPRSSVVQLAWGEMRKVDQNRSIALPVLQYLAGTEPHKQLRGYYKAMSIVMTKGLLPSQAIQKWPTRMPASKTRYSLAQHCQLFRQAGGK